MSLILTCEDEAQNLGVEKCIKIPQLLKGIITTPDSFTVPAATAGTAAPWQAALLAAKSSRIYLFPEIKRIEDISEENIYEEGPVGSIAVRDGRYRWRMSFVVGLEKHKALISHKNFQGRIFLIDIENKIVGTSSDGGLNFQGFKLDLINPEKLGISDGTLATASPVYVSLADNKELDERGGQVDAGFLGSLIKLSTATIATSAITNVDLVVDLKNLFDSEAVLGFSATSDWVVKNSAGTPIAASGVVDNADGTYLITVAIPTATDYTISLAAPDSTPSVLGFETADTLFDAP